MENTFYQLALVLILASSIGVVANRLKLPLVISYLATGLFLSLVRLFDIGHSPIFEVLPNLGIALILFLIGMELKLSEFKLLGRAIFVTALGQIVLSTFLGFGLARLLGFDSIESFYLGLGLAFSSTVVVIKLLLDNRDLTSLYGKLSVGILLVEDLVAIVVLILISVNGALNQADYQNVHMLFFLLLKAAALFLSTFVLSKYILGKIFEHTAHSVELLYISAITWCFTFTGFAVFLGFSIEIGAFLAGVALASSPYHLQIQAKIKPMRDFFLALFFIYLGAEAEFKNLPTVLPIVVIFTLYALVIKPVVYAFLLSRFGFKKHTLFQTALHLSQISEFSLVVLLVGVKAGLVSQQTTSIMALVAVASITASSVLISFAKHLYKHLGPLALKLETKHKPHLFEQKTKHDLADHIVVIGGHRVGGPVIEYLKNTDIPFVVVDFNPTVIRELRGQGVNALYGDIGDPDIFEFLHVDKAKLVICTATDFSDNELLLKFVKEHSHNTRLVLRASDSKHAQTLRQLGADYVILPEKVSGDFIVSQLKQTWPKIHFKDVVANRKMITSLS